VGECAAGGVEIHKNGNFTLRKIIFYFLFLSSQTIEMKKSKKFTLSNHVDTFLSKGKPFLPPFVLALARTIKNSKSKSKERKKKFISKLR
jgi:hypothetical protein